MVKSVPLSLVIITRNAEAHLQKCLQSVPFAEDKLVLDCGSTDRTQEIARENGARVVVEEWRGFGLQKRRATELAKTDWVLNLDADEALSPESQKEVLALFQDGSRRFEESAFQFPRLSYHMGRWIWHGGWYPDWQTRLYDRKRANWTSAQLHEKVQCESGKLARLKKPILHWVFKDLADQVQTNNRYSTLGCEELRAKGKRFSHFNLLVKPLVKFLETYVWKRGFLDGIPGFVISVGAGYSVFLRWAKLWEHEKQENIEPR